MNQRVNITIPVYNEEKELESSISELVKEAYVLLASYNWIVVIADNASTDSTGTVAQKLVDRNKHIRYLKLKEKGRGRAIKKSWSTYFADYYCYMDVDLSTNLKHLPELIHLLNTNNIVIGSRLRKSSQVINRSLKREIISRIYNIIIKLMFQTHFADAQCGFKGITEQARTQIVPAVHDNEWFFDTELLILAEKTGYSIHEIPVMWKDDPGSTVRVLPTALGDLRGLLRLFFNRPWRRIRKKTKKT